MTDNNLIKCIEPTEVGPTDILDYAEGIGRPDFAKHLAHCAFCSSEVREAKGQMAVLEKRLRRKMPQQRANCPDPQRIGEYSLGLLKGVARKTLKNHLADCPYCQLEYQIFEEGKNSELAAPALPIIIARLFARPSLATAMREQQPPPLSEPVLPEGIRAKAGELTEYEADEVIISLIISPLKLKRDKLSITGEISRENYNFSSKVRVRVKQADVILATAVTNDLGNFYFSSLRVAGPDPLSLEIEFNDKIVVVETL